MPHDQLIVSFKAAKLIFCQLHVVEQHIKLTNCQFDVLAIAYLKTSAMEPANC